MTLEEFEAQNNSQISMQDRLIADGNHLSNILKTDFGPALEKLEPKIKLLIDSIGDHIGPISTSLGQFFTVVQTTIPVMAQFGDVMVGIVKLISKLGLGAMYEYYRADKGNLQNDINDNTVDLFGPVKALRFKLFPEELDAAYDKLDQNDPRIKALIEYRKALFKRLEEDNTATQELDKMPKALDDAAKAFRAFMVDIKTIAAGETVVEPRPGDPNFMGPPSGGPAETTDPKNNTKISPKSTDDGPHKLISAEQFMKEQTEHIKKNSVNVQENSIAIKELTDAMRHHSPAPQADHTNNLPNNQK